MGLNLTNVDVVYGGVIQVLRSANLEVPDGKMVVLLGSNGAGKTTTLRAISGLLHADLGQVTAGEIRFDGADITNGSPIDIFGRGIVQVLEGRKVLEHLTVEQNLRIGAHRRSDLAAVRRDLEKVYHYFPRLRERRSSQAGYTSGGEQQMVAIGRALMSRPTTILLDEPSMGLAPQLVEEIFEIVKNLNERDKVSILLAEQNTNIALLYAHYGYILENGRVVLDGDAAGLRENEDVKEFYLGIGGDGRRSFRDVKHYRRRKRWL